MLTSWMRRKGDDPSSKDLVRGELLALRAALDEVSFGVVLLDAELRAQFINRAFRTMWRLPDAKADSKPAFVALMYHGRDMRAYEVPAGDLDGYVAERVARVKAGDPEPLDLRLANGEVIRFQCAVLPAGGRMLSYTYVTDIVRHSDELETLRVALDKIDEGVVLLDENLRAQFTNRAVRKLWNIPDEQADTRPAYADLVKASAATGVFGIAAEQLDDYVAQRISAVRAGDPTAVDLPVSDGRAIRARCAVLPNGGRILIYNDVTDLIRHANELEQIATVDGMTNLFNRRHFLALAQAEWMRFQRYHRPLSLLVIDVDRFKSINDRFGHDGGDQALIHVAKLCSEDKRATDIVARIGGEEFAVLLPETALAQASIVAERIRQRIFDGPLFIDGAMIEITVSIGIAAATLSMSSFGALMKLADKALYDAKLNGRNRVSSAPTTPAEFPLQLAAE